MARSICSVEGCDKPVDSRGWCAAHRARWRRYGDPLGGTPPRRDGDTTLEEVLWLRGGGLTPHEIAVALNMTPAAIERLMSRRGRPDLAALFQAEDNWSNRKVSA
jgi:hypothetical protein